MIDDLKFTQQTYLLRDFMNPQKEVDLKVIVDGIDMFRYFTKEDTLLNIYQSAIDEDDTIYFTDMGSEEYIPISLEFEFEDKSFIYYKMRVKRV